MAAKGIAAAPHPIEHPRSLTDLVRERVRGLIVDGTFELGEMISEERLSAALGVSRSPVRDALNELKAIGLVVVIPKKGSFVFDPSLDDVAAICEYRGILEFSAAKLAAERASAAALVELRDAMARMKVALADDDPVAYGQYDTAFHQIFFRHAANPFLAEAYALVSSRIAALRTHLTASYVDRRQRSFDEHGRLVGYFAAGDMAGFNALLQGHILLTKEVYVLEINRRLDELKSRGIQL